MDTCPIPGCDYPAKSETGLQSHLLNKQDTDHDPYDEMGAVKARLAMAREGVSPPAEEGGRESAHPDPNESGAVEASPDGGSKEDAKNPAESESKDPTAEAPTADPPEPEEPECPECGCTDWFDPREHGVDADRGCPECSEEGGPWVVYDVQ